MQKQNGSSYNFYTCHDFAPQNLRVAPVRGWRPRQSPCSPNGRAGSESCMVKETINQLYSNTAHSLQLIKLVKWPTKIFLSLPRKFGIFLETIFFWVIGLFECFVLCIITKFLICNATSLVKQMCQRFQECSLWYRGYSCYRLSAILKVKLKSFHYFVWMALTTCLLTMCAGWGKYPSESEWKPGRVRIVLQTPFLLVPLENTDSL